MPDGLAIRRASETVQRALENARGGLVDRAVLVELVVLSAIAGEHMLVIGPPGTAKSEAVRRVARGLGGRYFEYLLGRFTEPSEIFGPVDLRRLRDGVVETQTAGMLPEAEVAFLDEVFLGSTAILNTLLGVLNERVFRRGHTLVKCPLRVCVGAANRLPEDESLAAFADRFLVRCFVEPVADPQIEELLGAGWAGAGTDAPQAHLGDLDVLTQAARSCDVASVRPLLGTCIRQLRAEGLQLTDRRVVKVQRLMAAAAVLAGRGAPSECDLWPLVFAVPEREQQLLAREILRDRLAPSLSDVLSNAAEDASLGPLARAHRLRAAAEQLLAEPPPPGEEHRAAWKLKLEGVAREIDATFTPEALPAALSETRAQLVHALER
jgi:MoxR-like ATPase